MGGWMTYGRFRRRNMLRQEQEQGRPTSHPTLVADLDRMERDYLEPEYPQHPFAQRPDGSDPAAECAQATGVPVEAVRSVLRYVFLDSR